MKLTAPCLLLVHAALLSTASAAPPLTPRAVAFFCPADTWVAFTITLLDDVLYAVDSERHLLVIDVAGIWEGRASLNTTFVDYPKGLMGVGSLGWVTDGEVARPVLRSGFAIDLRNRTAPKFYVSPDVEAYDALCFTARNGVKYVARPYQGANSSELWFVDARSPTVPVGAVPVLGVFDEGHAVPSCTEELMVASPYLLDIRDVKAPKVLGKLPGSTDPQQSIEDAVIDSERKLLFTWVATTDEVHLYTYNISNPAEPVELSKYPLQFLNVTHVKCHPDEIEAPTAAVSGGKDNGYFMHLVDDVLYMANAEGVMMVSVKAPTQPVNFATADFTMGLAHSFDVYKVNGTVYGVYTQVYLGHVCVIALHNDA